MRTKLSVISTPTADTPGTAYMCHFDSKRYLFGQIGEGSQRCFNEATIAVKKLSNIFITGKCQWDNVGGLIGMILTLADVRATMKEAILEARAESSRKREKRGLAPQEEDDEEIDISLEICGPPNLVHSVAAARRFVFRKGLPLTIEEVSSSSGTKLLPDSNPEPSWQDENIKVWAMNVVAESPEPSEASPATTMPINPRKRSFEQANGTAESTSRPSTGSASVDAILGASSTDTEREADEHWVRQNVISSMFGSNWSLDKLDEMHITEAKLPARLWIRDPDTKDLREYTGPLPGGSEPVPDIRVLVRRPWPGALIRTLPPTRPKEEAVSYIVGMFPRRGKFDARKAVALGLKAGPAFSELAKGNSVINKDGVEIKPEQVLGEDQQGAGFAIVDLPSVDYVLPLIRRSEWQCKALMHKLGVINWILGPGVADNPDLRKFIEDHADIEHVVSSREHSPNEIVLRKAAKLSVQLSQIDKGFYPEPYLDRESLPQRSFLEMDPEPVAALPASVQVAQRGLTFQLQPEYQLDTSTVDMAFDRDEVLKECLPEVAELAATAQSEAANNVSLEQWKSGLAMPDTEITTLGTGSAIPSVYRNVSATLVRIPGIGNYLLDCGENTLGQLQRVFPPAELAAILKDLRMIWISHMHADHHLGTASLIKAWYRVVHGKTGQTPPVSTDYVSSLQVQESAPSDGPTDSRSPYLAVISDQQYMHYLSEYASVEDFGYSHVLPLAIDSAKGSNRSRLQMSHHDCAADYLNKRFYPQVLGFSNIQACDVKHCHGAKGVAITWPQWTAGSDGKPFKISYSGDCRPSASLAYIGRGSTVLVHEATFDDDLKGEARAKNHSTTSEALDIGKQMQAKAVVLTHFSQRYGKIPGAEWSGPVPGKDGTNAKNAIAQEQAEVAKDALPGWGEVAKVDGAAEASVTDIKPEVILEQGSREPADHEVVPQTEFARTDGAIGVQSESSSAPVTAGDTTMTDVSKTETAPPTALTSEDISMPDATPVQSSRPNETASSGSRPQTPSRSADEVVNVEAPPGDQYHSKSPNVQKTHAITRSRSQSRSRSPSPPPGPQSKMKVCVAFDYMRVRISEIARMQQLRPALVKLFEKELAEEESPSDTDEQQSATLTAEEKAKIKADKNKAKQKALKVKAKEEQIRVVQEGGPLSKKMMKRQAQKAERAELKAIEMERKGVGKGDDVDGGVVESVSGAGAGGDVMSVGGQDAVIEATKEQ